MNPRTTLQERFPLADLFEYFRFLGECAGTPSEKGRTHNHHICPRKQFPEYEHAPENSITLTIEDHAHAHELLANAVQELRTQAAWIAAPHSPEARRKQSEAMRGHFVSEETRRKIVETRRARGSYNLSEEHRRKLSEVMRGDTRNRGRKHSEETRLKNSEAHRGLKYKPPSEEARRRQSEALRGKMPTGTHTRWHVNRNIVNPNCELCR